MGVVLVAGVTGNIGSRVARKLAATGVEVRGVARYPSAFEGEGVDLLQADLTDTSAADRALEGVDSVYLTLPEAGENPLGLESAVATNVVRAAAEAGVRHLVAQTAVHADRGDTGARILDNKHPVEKAIEDSGLGFTILRPGWFLQNLFGARGYLEQGMFAMPWPVDRAWAGTSVEDVAEAAVAFLEQGPANAAFDVHIPGGVTGAGICEAAGAVLGRDVAYHEFPGPTREFVEPFPLSPALKDLYAELFDYFRRVDYQGEPTRIVSALPGFEATSLEAFLREELFAAAQS
ncbi:MAG: SDR family oxidoreductase [Actinomycetota bacterium]